MQKAREEERKGGKERYMLIHFVLSEVSKARGFLSLALL